jgi:hypothetical protein
LSIIVRRLYSSEALGVDGGLEGKTGDETYRLETVAKTIGNAHPFQVPPYNSNGFIGSKRDPDFKLIVDLDGIFLQALELQIVEIIVVGKIAANVRLPSPQGEPQGVNGILACPNRRIIFSVLIFWLVGVVKNSRTKGEFKVFPGDQVSTL